MRPEHWLYTVPLRLRSLFRRGQVERELDEELQYHLERQIQENRARGLSPEEARRAALRAMDGLEQRKEECRDMRRMNYFEDLLHDVRFGLRMLRRNPGLTTVAVLTLALGIGATTAIFSVVNSILLRPLPFPDPERLVILQESVPKLVPGKFPVSAPDVPDFRRLNHVFEDVGAFNTEKQDLTGNGPPERVRATRTSAAVFRILRATPELGRTFTDDEDALGHRVAVIGHALWQGRYGGDRDILGKTIFLDRQPYTVIGVMPKDFEFPLQGMANQGASFLPGQLWVPIAFNPEELGNRGDNFNYGVLARMRPGVTLAAANTDTMVVAHQIQQQFYPPEASGMFELEASVTPLREILLGPAKVLLFLLLGAVGLLLLIACANVANLLLARGTERQKEIAVRVALGAARRRLVRQLLVESSLLGLLGGALGLLSAYAGVKGLISLALPILPRMQEVRIDAYVLWFTLGLSLLCGLLFGTLPALAATREDLHEALKEGGRSASSGRGQRRLRDAFVIVQMALALLLVTGSGLLVRSFVRARQTDPGFRSENLMAVSISLPLTEYHDMVQVQGFYDRLFAQTRTLPGVVAAAMSSDLPMNSGWTHVFTAEGHEAEQRSGVPTNSHTLVERDYFPTLGIPLVRGRFFNETEMSGQARAVIISEGMARRYWPGEDPVGRRLKWGPALSKSEWLTIVGVVGDMKQGPLDAATKPHTFEPFRQVCQAQNRFACLSRFVLVRSTTPPSELVAAVRGIVQRLDPQQPVGPVRLMEDVIAETLAPRRFNTFLLGVFAVAALALAAIGIYGVLAYNVARQTRELGVRMALGAQRGEILKLVLAKGLKLAVVGLGIGLAASMALTRLMSSLLYEVSATDPLTFVSVAALFLAVASLACWVPGRRATTVDPSSALRYE